MGGPEGRQALADHALGKFRAIAVAAQVAEEEMAQLGGDDLRGDLRRGVVGEMAVPAEDALFRAPGPPGVVLEHFHVVIGFENERVRGPDPLDDEFRGRAEIGEETCRPQCTGKPTGSQASCGTLKYPRMSPSSKEAPVLKSGTQAGIELSSIASLVRRLQ
jgi:hypothetical protein